jgi:predicted RNA-binding Zn-ribbon protein involved in translation (DUF1610 family)/exonuclease VII small subunit
MTTPANKIRETQKIQAVDAAEDTVRPTDILFNCPHCGHNLCIDCRGAGLLTNCTECGKEVLVPIPDGMNVADVDLTRDQTIGQLLYTRRLLSRAEHRIAELEEMVSRLQERQSDLDQARRNTLHQCDELAALCQNLQHNQGETAAILERMQEIVAGEQQP